MKCAGYWAMMLVAAMGVGCNRATNRDVARDDKAIGTAGDVDRNRPTDGDQKFVNDLAIAGMAEVKLGMLASETSRNAEVKKFGQMMVTDHTKAGDALKMVAMQHGIVVPAEIDAKHRDLYDKLAKLQGAEFDREYMAAMVDGHGDVVDKLESRIDRENLTDWKTRMADWLSGKGTRPEAVTVTPEHSDNGATMAINQWSADAYPTVQGHLVEAKALKSSVDKSPRR